jgi:formate dehydrogenase major subunit
MISITIDGRTIEVPAGTSVLKAAQIAGIKIPTLCNHPAVKAFGGCRLCIVDVQGVRTLQASCTLPATNGMVVLTDTPKIRDARKLILELLFSERNHFCMYCHKTGGSCELQNAAYFEGIDHWPMQPVWNSFPVDASHPYFIFDHNRCILCRRCVRGCAELVGNFTLAVENRGANCMIVADYGLPMGESSCIKCGTCLQICPTGAIIDRHSAYLLKGMQGEGVPSICTACSLGCGITVYASDGQVARIDGDWTTPVSGGLLCETGRFLPVNETRQRIQSPMLRKDGTLRPVSWEEVLTEINCRLNEARLKHGDGLAALTSARLPAEALYAFDQLFKNQLQASLVASLENEPVLASTDGMSGDLEALKTADCVLTIGADLWQSQQVAGFFIKRNLPLGTRLIVVDANENTMKEAAAYSLTPKSGSEVELLYGMLAELVSQGTDIERLPFGFNLARYRLSHVSDATGVSGDLIAKACHEIRAAQHPVVIFGKGITADVASQVVKAITALVRLTNASVIPLRAHANSHVAHLYKLDQPVDLSDKEWIYLALGEDELQPGMVDQIRLGAFVAVQASYFSAATDRADVVFPVESWAEQSGHFMNLEGRLQQVQKVIDAPEQVWSNLNVLRSLAGYLNVTLDDRWYDPLGQPEPAAV